MIMHCLISFLAILPHAAAFGFTFPKVRINPALLKYEGAEKESCFELKLIVGPEESPLPIDGLILKLEDDKPEKDKLLSMPGANGPNKQLSTGVRSINVLQNARFIDMSGSQKVELSNGCWEMGWRDEVPAGALVCGFDNPKIVKRNSASLPSGRIYISFPMWTEASLVEGQAKKKDVEEAADKYMKEKNYEIVKMSETSNPLMKALHYRNAFAAAEKLSLGSMRSNSSRLIMEVPERSDVISIKDDLLLTTKGTVWTKKEGFFGDGHILLGYATLSLGTDSSLKP